MTKRRLFEIIEAGASGDIISKGFDLFMVCLIFLNVLAVVLETVGHLAERLGDLFFWFEIFSVAAFTIEYAARVWTCTEKPHEKYSHPITGRLRFMASPLALIDLLAILPFYLSVFVTFDLRFLRVFRLLRILKLTRYSGAMDTLIVVFRNERKPLFAAITIMLTLLVFLSGIVYFLERDAQPEAFSSIPQAMWWGMATLTTVGYGDVVPVTVLGKVAGSVVTLMGLGMFALPAAILASGFTREARRREFIVTWKMVAKVPLFEHLPAIIIADIAELLRPGTAVPKEIILKKGTIGTSMFFIVSGEVEVDLPTGPVRLGRGDYFGEIALIYTKPRSATVTTVTSSQFLVLSCDDFEDVMRHHPAFREAITTAAKKRLGETSETESSLK